MKRIYNIGKEGNAVQIVGEKKDKRENNKIEYTKLEIKGWEDHSNTYEEPDDPIIS